MENRGGWVAFLPFIAAFLPFIASFYAIYCFIFGLNMNGDLGLFKNVSAALKAFPQIFRNLNFFSCFGIVWLKYN